MTLRTEIQEGDHYIIYTEYARLDNWPVIRCANEAISSSLDTYSLRACRVLRPDEFKDIEAGTKLMRIRPFGDRSMPTIFTYQRGKGVFTPPPDGGMFAYALLSVPEAEVDDQVDDQVDDLTPDDLADLTRQVDDLEEAIRGLLETVSINTDTMRKMSERIQVLERRPVAPLTLPYQTPPYQYPPGQMPPAPYRLWCSTYNTSAGSA